MFGCGETPLRVRPCTQNSYILTGFRYTMRPADVSATPRFDPFVITLSINGELRQIDAVRSCADLITALGFAGKRVALECNGEIVPRSHHAEHALKDGDKIEIVVAVGGG